MSRSLICVLLFSVAIATYAWLSFRNLATANDRVTRVAELSIDGEDKTLNRVTAKTFRMSKPASTLCRSSVASFVDNPHGYHYCHVFVTPNGNDIMLSGEGTYSEGTVIVKQKFSDDSGIDTILFTVMKKMPMDYDREHGNWEYSIIDADGKKVLSKGRIESCIRCHDSYAETDFVTRAYLDDSIF